MAGNYRYLTFEDRQKIEAWHAHGDRPLEIAARLGVHAATIYHELQRGYIGERAADCREVYSAAQAQQTVQTNFKRRGKQEGSYSNMKNKVFTVTELQEARRGYEALCGYSGQGHAGNERVRSGA